MRNVSSLKGLALWAATLGLLMPPQCLIAAERAAGNSATAAPTARAGTAIPIADVQLQSRGRFSGQIVNAQGQPQVGIPVVLQGRGQQMKTSSDKQGWFHYEGLSGGSYRLEAAGQQNLCRLWAPGTAPPKANQQLLLVNQNGQIVLGQYCGSPVCGSPVGGAGSRVKNALTHPLVIGGIVAAAIAIPVAIHNADDDDSGS
jgi:hypothetical protein